MPYRSILLTTVLAAGSASTGLPAAAQQLPPSLDAGIKKIYASPEYAPRQRFGPAEWIDGGAGYTTVEASAEIRGAGEIVRYQTATGARSVFLPARNLVPAGATEPIEIEEYSLSPDGSRILIFTNTAKVWRDNTRGDYWVFDRKTSKLTKLGGPDAKPATLMYAKFAPTNDRVGYVREGEVYVEPLDGGPIVKLTTGADSLHVNGMTDWVYEEEFGIRDGFRWSPDGSRIAYLAFDMTGVGTFQLINTTDSIYPFVIPIQYPKVGTSNSAVRAGVVRATGGPTRWLALPGDPRADYLPRMEWAGPEELVIQRMNRLQNTNRILLASAETGAVKEIMVDRDSAWLDVVDDLQWLDGGKAFTWVSDREGFKRVYRVSRDGKTVTAITPADYDVVDVVAIDDAKGWLYYIASPDDPLRRYLFRTRLDGKGTPARLSPADQPGTHGYDIAPNAEWAFHTFSRADRPPTLDLVKLPSHQNVRTFVDDAEQRRAVAGVMKTPREFFRVDIGGGVQLDGWMIKPASFDSTRSWPVLFYVYGEPAGQTVTDAWAGPGMLWHHLVADQGYVVVSVDNRGTPAPRGREWRKVIYGQIGIIGSADQAAAVRALTARHRWLDPNRVAIWGWSGGGSSTLQAMFRYPDVYQVGMAVAPVPDQLLYDTIYQERYMGLPSLNPERYEKASPVNFAAGLQGRLLLVHGSGDDNVHMQGSEKLINNLVKAGKQFDLMTYPNRSHCICEGPGTTLHIYSLLSRYLTERLPAGPRTPTIP